MSINIDDYKWACSDCLIASHDSSYDHPRGIDNNDIAFLNWDYCTYHTDDCINCGGAENPELQAYMDDNDGFHDYALFDCDICETREGGQRYRYRD